MVLIYGTLGLPGTRGHGVGASWPVIDGNFVLGEPEGPVAVCALTSEQLPPQLVQLPGVAIAGQVYTANLGLERIIRNVTTNPAIRFLVLCGKDSKLFRPGQALSALAEDGVDDQHRIIGAQGYEPVLPGVPASSIEVFRRQVEVVDWIGEDDPAALAEQIEGVAARNPGPFSRAGEEAPVDLVAPPAAFVPIRPGGRREPLQYDPKGYFVITLDREEDQIVLQHYLPDHTAAHEMRGRVAESMLLGLLREGLISQLSHAGYLGGELAKAQAALNLGLRYRQDRPLQAAPVKPAGEPDVTPAGDGNSPPRIAPPMGLEQLRAAGEGDAVDVVLEAADQPSSTELSGWVLEPSERSPFSEFQRSDQPLTVRWGADTKVVMGEPADVVVGGIFRVKGPLGPGRTVDATVLVVLSHVATVK